MGKFGNELWADQESLKALGLTDFHIEWLLANPYIKHLVVRGCSGGVYLELLVGQDEL